MKVLWFEVGRPGRYDDDKAIIGGWQDSLEEIVRSHDDIELFISFEGNKTDKAKTVGKIKYIPIPTKVVRRKDYLRNKISWDVNKESVCNYALQVIENVTPDIIHIFGMEWSWAHITKHTNIPCVVHVMGSIVPYYNAKYPPSYSALSFYRDMFPNLKAIWDYYCEEKKARSWLCHEYEKWAINSNFMGRTEWDENLVNILHPGSKYFHVDEAIRPLFYNNGHRWAYKERPKIKLITVGCSSFWKGPDVLLKTAHVLKTLGTNFEWNVIGNMSPILKRVVERKEKLSFEENSVFFKGFLKADEFIDLLCDSSIYVHTAYIENSPNSVCEAQLVGIPVISTNVGGISTLLEESGVLVPANDPWQLAASIMSLNQDKNKQDYFSTKGREIALRRHNNETIYNQLINCYKQIINN